jgi:hypothetical protein
LNGVSPSVGWRKNRFHPTDWALPVRYPQPRLG